jgi:hypothetical protein
MSDHRRPIYQHASHAPTPDARPIHNDRLASLSDDTSHAATPDPRHSFILNVGPERLLIDLGQWPGGVTLIVDGRRFTLDPFKVAEFLTTIATEEYPE